MKNVFDQYDQPENRLTHALFCALHHDRHFLKAFLKRYARDLKLDYRHLAVDEQSVPTTQVDRGRRSRASLPDGVVSDRNGRALIVESKIASPLLSNQLRRHTLALRNQGYDKVNGLAIVASQNSIKTIGWKSACWTDLYEWSASQTKQSVWVRELRDYLEILEAQMIEQDSLGDRALTKFNGIPFSKDHPYTYREAKRLLKLLRSKLMVDKSCVRDLGADPRDSGRKAITEQVVSWDYLLFRRRPKNELFTKYPHLTFGIGAAAAQAYITVPNAADRRLVSALCNTSRHELEAAVEASLKVFDRSVGRRVDGIKPLLRITQGHFRTQKSPRIVDGTIQFDLRTTIAEQKRRRGTPKLQPEWLDAAQKVFQNKRSNMQLQIGCEFEYRDCPAVRSAEAQELFIIGWKVALAFFNKLGMTL
jgi:hypothetical protein